MTHGAVFKPLREEALSLIPHHGDDPAVTRFVTAGGPGSRLVVHRLDAALSDVRTYVAAHSHNVDEYMLVLPDPGTELVFLLQLGDESMPLEGPQLVTIPASITHAANVLEGSGWAVFWHGDSL